MHSLPRMKFLFRIILCAAFFLFGLWTADPSLAAAPGRTVNGTSAWKPIGPPGGNFNRLAVNARNPREAFALTSWSQLFRTTNGGQSWSLVAFFDSSYSNGVALDPFDAGVIYLPVFRNIQISKDHGATWTAHFLGMSCQADGPISVHPLDPKLIYASGRTIYNKKPQKRCMALFISKDGGTTWSVSDISPTGSDGYVTSLAAAPTNSKVVYVSGYNGSKYGIFKTKDGGKTWTDVSGTLTQGVFELVVDPKDADHIYAGTSAGVFESMNGGRTWTAKGESFIAYTLLIDAANPKILYAGSKDACYKSIDSGDHWKCLTGISGRCMTGWASAGTVYFGTGYGIFKTVNGGKSWKAVNTGLQATSLRALAVAPSSAKTIYAASYSSAFFRTSDGGERWVEACLSDYSANAIGMAVHPSQPARILMLVKDPCGDLIAQSTNGGRTWQELLTAGEMRRLDDIVIHPKNADIILVAGRIKAGNLYQMTLFKSVDGGAHWTTQAITSKESSGMAVGVNPLNDKILYLGGHRNYKGVLYKSLDGGSNWTEIGAGVFGWDHIYDLAVDPASGNVIFAGTAQGIYKSADSGASWKKVSESYSIHLLINPRNGNEIYGAGSDGVFRSVNSGKTWTEYNTGLLIKDIGGLAFSPSGSTLYTIARGGGIWKIKN